MRVRMDRALTVDTKLGSLDHKRMQRKAASFQPRKHARTLARSHARTPLLDESVLGEGGGTHQLSDDKEWFANSCGAVEPNNVLVLKPLEK